MGIVIDDDGAARTTARRSAEPAGLQTRPAGAFLQLHRPVIPAGSEPVSASRFMSQQRPGPRMIDALPLRG